MRSSAGAGVDGLAPGTRSVVAAELGGRGAGPDAAQEGRGEDVRVLAAVLRVQCAWRLKQGRFSLFLKRRARDAREEERIYAATDIQRVARGHLGRVRFDEIRRAADAEARASRALPSKHRVEGIKYEGRGSIGERAKTKA